MILQALCNYYNRMSRDPQSDMPRVGFSVENIAYALSIRPDGTLGGIVDLQNGAAKKKEARRLAVPAAEKRSSGIVPNFLWDHTGYVLGVDGKGKPEKTARRFEAFKKLHNQAAQESGHEMLKALAVFLNSWRPEDFTALTDVDPQDMIDKNCVFMWHETGEFIHEAEGLQRPAQVSAEKSRCLVSGRLAPIAKIHPNIKGVWGGQSSGGAIVSFNLESFASYGKEQGFNAPVSEQAAAAYTSALNYLLERGRKRRLQIGDASTVFWAEKPTPGEDLLHALLAGEAEKETVGDEAVPPDNEAQPQRRRLKKSLKGETRAENTVAQQVRSLLEKLLSGSDIAEALPDIDPAVRFYILGLAPNAARISIRYWQVSTFGELALNVARHQKDISIAPRYENDPKFPPLWRLLTETAVQGKSENILPPLAAGLQRSVLAGAIYPVSLLVSVINRIRADQEISYIRAALIKGCLTRNYKKETSFMLDETRKDAPYLLGRLFAILEKAQTDALGASLNATIRDKFIASASAAPSLVFPRLLRLVQYHVAKSEYGGLTEKRIEEVMNGLDGFPAHLSLEDQGIFFIGYYHQRNANYSKKAKVEE
jgi:CRISPR-associated protein Csd1